MLWDVANGRAQIMGVWTELIRTSIGHYGIDIKAPQGRLNNSNNEICLNSVENCLVNMPESNETSLEKELWRLHRQFGHPSEKKWELFMRLCKEGVWNKKKKQIMAEIYKKCETCKVFKKTPPKPVVKLPITCEFNKVVTLDLKEKKIGRFNYILHIIDAFTRLSASAFIQ